MEVHKQVVNRKNIDNFKQNKPSLLAEDLCYRVMNKEEVYKVLMARGVFKWMANRRNLIRLKDEWKDRLKKADEEYLKFRKTSYWTRKWYLKGYRAALIECRQEVRDLCHSPRWQVQDNDSGATKWLISQIQGIGSGPSQERSHPESKELRRCAP